MNRMAEMYTARIERREIRGEDVRAAGNRPPLFKQEGLTALSSRPRSSKLSNLELMGRLKDLNYLTPTQMMDIHERMSARVFEKGDIIFREEGSPIDSTILLLLGTAEWSSWTVIPHAS
jgi:hypothetical protein